MTTAQLQTLKTELTTDPQTYGYGSMSDADAAAALNKPRDGSDGEAAISVKRTDIQAREIYEAIAVTDYTALPGSPNATQLSTERRYLAWLTGLTALQRIRLVNEDGSDTPVLANLSAMFGAGTGTRTRLAGITVRTGTRAEQLLGRDTVIDHTDVAQARALA